MISFFVEIVYTGCQLCYKGDTSGNSYLNSQQESITGFWLQFLYFVMSGDKFWNRFTRYFKRVYHGISRDNWFIFGRLRVFFSHFTKSQFNGFGIVCFYNINNFFHFLKINYKTLRIACQIIFFFFVLLESIASWSSLSL